MYCLQRTLAGTYKNKVTEQTDERKGGNHLESFISKFVPFTKIYLFGINLDVRIALPRTGFDQIYISKFFIYTLARITQFSGLDFEINALISKKHIYVDKNP